MFKRHLDDGVLSGNARLTADECKPARVRTLLLPKFTVFEMQLRLLSVILRESIVTGVENNRTRLDFAVSNEPRFERQKTSEVIMNRRLIAHFRCIHLFCCFATIFSLTSFAQADNNWSNWRGPNYDGSLEGVQPPTQWNATKNVKWKSAIPGSGSGSPIVWEDTIYVVTAVKTDKTAQPEMKGVPPGPAGRGGGGGGRGGMNNAAPSNVYQFAVLAFDRHSGEQQWMTVVKEAVPHEGGHKTNTFASGSPVTDGKHIYVSFGSFGVYCLDMNGKQIWQTDLGKMTTRNAFGEASTPALYGDTLIVPWDQDGYEDKNDNGERDVGELLSSLVALNATTGEIKWRTPRPTEPTTWATPLIVEHDGTTQVITNGTTVRSYDITNGKRLWECGGQVTNPIPSPIVSGDHVICMTGYRGNAIYSMALDSRGRIDGTDKVKWSRDDAAPYVASATLYDGQLYLTKSRDGIMTSVDVETGEVIIPPKRLSKIRDIYASAVAAGGHVYFTSRDGVTTVIKHGQTFEEVSVNELGEAVDASPAIVGNEIIIRAAEHLYCISEQD